MSSPFSRLLELIGWAVVGLTVILLLVAHQIDRYTPPQKETPLQHT
ncbi:division septum protein Blr [Superficieibacter electus]|uniref:Division septum protein Blr n=1 Tax=Superficieibacter electus TaxID=2022662 RepID=A0A2P5GTZ0_9ENTR|nr:division septum protein Blr [Superficieibacter electus]POP47176.1 division septum protein Blr [Superficieibacter electus]POP50022.1 division septum protein Blr [Superficieibacter electus]